MPRFFVPPISGDRALISGEDAAHITKSLRLRPDEEITLCDGSGMDYAGRVLAVGDPVEVEILSRSPSIAEPKCRLILFQALPKGDKMEFIIQKSVELGAAEIIPVLTSRCVSRPDAKSMAKKLERYRKIAAEAAKQCGRGIIPQVGELMTLEQAAKALPEKSLVFYEGGGKRLSELVAPEDESWGVFVGSEGGFSPEEIALLESRGVCPATLGPRILRCETAPLCGLSVMLNLLGEM
ncbi:MAG TPA: 16S rRNA (uracil(1498)-N(3))-methyltransferase [Candidatus Merdivicinus excrementipullorum]|uniref:Ribosomal RNA small subunit methyltransferase E n=1 Tax=Candidatus Merdivicinus excrementipullorum TaxID=2840867 RepID=A0A9D1JY89_9FIRM|nr:16S rRNA (uracil(1498)-N(3))-methyltransferase [Candidatus Merdivicinus excrementipullorum]